jgi:hypothetical protein
MMTKEHRMQTKAFTTTSGAVFIAAMVTVAFAQGIPSCWCWQ